MPRHKMTIKLSNNKYIYIYMEEIYVYLLLTKDIYWEKKTKNYKQILYFNCWIDMEEIFLVKSKYFIKPKSLCIHTEKNIKMMWVKSCMWQPTVNGTYEAAFLWNFMFESAKAEKTAKLMTTIFVGQFRKTMKKKNC